MPAPNRTHPDHIEVPEDAVTVAPKDGHAHGYFGTVTDPTPNEDYTVAGVTSRAAAAAEKVEKVATSRRAAKD